MKYLIILLFLFGCNAQKEIQKPEIKEVIKYVYVSDTTKHKVVNYFDELNDLNEELYIAYEKVHNYENKLLDCQKTPKKIIIKRNRINSDNKNTNISDLQQKFDSIQTLYLNQSLDIKAKPKEILKYKEKNCSHLIYYIVIFSLIAIICFLFYRKFF
jgi:hypothetical protein